MTTQYSPILKLALPVQGELSGTWGDVVNDNITSMVEQAIAGRAVINTWTTNSHTLTSANGTTSESRCAMLELTDTGTALSGAGTVVCPTASKIYIVKNAAGQNITVKTSGGTGILVPNGRTTFLFCDGTNVVEALTHTTSLQLGTSTTVTAVLDEDNMASNSATSLATQQSIKAYVDAQVGANNELSEVLANGNTTGGTDISVSTGDDITFADSSKAIFGAGSDLQIYHDGAQSFVQENGTGQLVLDTQNGARVKLTANNGTENMVVANKDGDVELYYDNAQKLATTSTGVDITGNATFADNGKAIFGAGSDLQIYHDGAAGHSYITESGTGSLIIKGQNLRLRDASDNNYLFAESGGAVTLYYDNAQKLATTSTGVDVTGTLTSDGLTVDKTATISTTDYYASSTFSGTLKGAANNTKASLLLNSVSSSGQNSFASIHSEPIADFRASLIGTYSADGSGAGYFSIKQFVPSSSATLERMRIDSSGNVGIGTDSPAWQLHVKGTSNAVVQIEGASIIHLAVQCCLKLQTKNVCA